MIYWKLNVKLQCIRFMGIYWQNMADTEYSILKYVFISHYLKINCNYLTEVSHLYLQRTQADMLHRHVFKAAQNGRPKHWLKRGSFYISFVVTVGSTTCLEIEDEMRCHLKPVHPSLVYSSGYFCISWQVAGGRTGCGQGWDCLLLSFGTLH